MYAPSDAPTSTPCMLHLVLNIGASLKNFMNASYKTLSTLRTELHIVLSIYWKLDCGKSRYCVFLDL